MSICLRAWTELDNERQGIPLLIPKGLGAFASHLVYGPIPTRRVVWWCRDVARLGMQETAIVQSVLRQLDIDRAERENSKLRR